MVEDGIRNNNLRTIDIGARLFIIKLLSAPDPKT